MTGYNVYCAICGGPPTGGYDEETKPAPGATVCPPLVGLSHDDNQWCHEVVAAYADCITPRGEFDWNTVSVCPYRNRAPNEYLCAVYRLSDGQRDVVPPEDPVHIPAWASENQPGFAEYIASDVASSAKMVHEVCLRLAAEWSRSAAPARFVKYGALSDRHTDPSKFFWNLEGPFMGFLCEEETQWDDEATTAFREKSIATMARLDVKRHYLYDDRYNYGYKNEEPPWREGCEQDYEHQYEYGITHLKRPDHFPKIHTIPYSNSSVFPQKLLFPIAGGLPLDVLLPLLTEGGLIGGDIRSLENVSRSWRNFIRSPVMQHHFWLKRVLLFGGEFTPTAADWTESAEQVRVAIQSAPTGEVVDWRRYYNDARKSLNLENRVRIKNGVRQLNHMMGNCGCEGDRFSESWMTLIETCNNLGIQYKA